MLRRRALTVVLVFSLFSGVTLAVGGATAGAQPNVIVTNYKITCTKINGSIRFTPTLVTPGVPVGVEKVTIGVKISGCTTTPNNIPGISGFISSSFLDNRGTSCATNLGLFVGYLVAATPLTVNWAGPIVPLVSLFRPRSMEPGLIAGKQAFRLPSFGVFPLPTVAGAFTGANFGNTSFLRLASGVLPAAVAAACAGPGEAGFAIPGFGSLLVLA